MSEVAVLKKEKNFFEARVIEYQNGGTLSWGQGRRKAVSSGALNTRNRDGENCNQELDHVALECPSLGLAVNLDPALELPEFEIGDQDLDPHGPIAGDGDRQFGDRPDCLILPLGLAPEWLDPGGRAGHH